MKKVFKKNNRFDKLTTGIFLAIVIAALIIGVAIYFGIRGAKEAKAPSSSPECLAPSEAMVTKVIDGDTVVVEGGYHVRLLGIDADERGYSCYEAAKSHLEELILNKEVRLEKDVTDVDQYDRCLRHIFLDDQNINLQLVEEGLVICRFYESDTKYSQECEILEKEAIENKIGCKWSSFASASAKATADKKATEDKGEKINFEWEELTTEETNLEVVFVCNAGSYFGEEIIVEGKIIDAYRSKTNTVFLNFEKAYPNQCFTGVIFSSDQYKFAQGPENYYSDKTVRVKGKIEEYQGQTEIILKDPSQIEIGK